MSQNLKFALKFSADTRQFINGVGQANVAVENINNSAANAANQLKQLNQQNQHAAKSFQHLSEPIHQAANGLAVKQLTEQDATVNASRTDAFYAETDQLKNAWLMRLAIMASHENEAKIREQYAYEERLGRLSQSFQTAYAQAQSNQNLQDQLEREYFASRETLRADHEANLTDIERQAIDERAAYQQTVAAELLTFTEQQFSITTHFLQQTGKEQSGLYRVLFAAQKMAAIPSMIVSTEEAATKAMAAYPPPAGTALAAAVRTMGYASVGIVAGTAIAGQAHDGINRVPATNEGTWINGTQPQTSG